MRIWMSRAHKRWQEAKSRLYTMFWYKPMFYKAGSHCSISPPFYTYKPEYAELGNGVSFGPACRLEVHPAQLRSKAPKPLLRIGNRVRLEHGVTISCHQSLVIEDHALIAGGCYIGDNNHKTDPSGLYYAEQGLTGSATFIGKGVWLGQNVCVLAGSFIGERSIIGAGSVVCGYIPPYCVAVGAPAKVVKQYDVEQKVWKRVSQAEPIPLVGMPNQIQTGT